MRRRIAPPRLVVLGRPGAGKGTQSLRLADRLGSVHLSTGDLLRTAIAEGSALGRKASIFVERGDLVPDSLMLDLLAERLEGDDVADSGFVLDGFPRTIRQAEALADLLIPQQLHAALNIEVPADVVVTRLAGRGRADDGADTVRRRLKVYDEACRPLLCWYETQGLLVAIDGNAPPEIVGSRIAAALDSRLAVSAGAGSAASAGDDDIDDGLTVSV